MSLNFIVNTFVTGYVLLGVVFCLLVVLCKIKSMFIKYRKMN